MKQITYTELAESIRGVYCALDAYQMDKHIPEFVDAEQKYAGDAYMNTIYEACEGQAPIFYHTFSPYDVVSKKAPDQALVFQGGEIKLNADFSGFVAPRTGVMTPIVARAIGWSDLSQKKVLFVGTGRVARAALKAFSELCPEVRAISYVNAGSDATEFTSLAETFGIATERGSLDQLEVYDLIICHTSAKQPVLTAGMVDRVKQGVLIATFASEDSADIASEFYDSRQAAVIVDWPKTADEANELKQAIASGLIALDDLVQLGDVLSGTAEAPRKQLTIYRSHGTPMQNVAVLKRLMRSGGAS